jgi:hypothetical protein
MKILIKECKKIMDIRVLLVIAVFTVLFYQLFLEVTIYPAGGQTTNSPYDMPFYAELIESWGTSLPREDWSKLDEKRKELEEAYTRIIAADPVLADAKITNYQEFSKTRETFFDKDTLTDEEKKIDQELSRLVFEDSKGSKLFFELQVLDRLDEYKNLQNGDSISLMPGGIFYIVEKDMRMMGILLLICFAILALPYLIRERLCHVLPLYATTATGRKLFDRQFQALVACCGFVGIVQFGIYVLFYVIKGLAVFWKGDCINDMGLQLWCKNLPFGFYMLLFMLLVFVFVLAAVVTAAVQLFLQNSYFSFAVLGLLFMGAYLLAYVQMGNVWDLIRELFNPTVLYATSGGWFMENDLRLSFAGNEFAVLFCSGTATVCLMAVGKRRYHRLEV